MGLKAPTIWGNVRLPQALLASIDQYLATDDAKRHGLSSRADVAITAIRSYLEQAGILRPLPRPRFEQLNHWEDHVKIIDHEQRRIACVYFRHGQAYCEVDDSPDCEHVRYALTLPDLQVALTRNGLKVPA